METVAATLVATVTTPKSTRPRQKMGEEGGGTHDNRVLSLERYGDQQHRRRTCPEFVADRAKVLMLEVILFYA
jgi:hypothetical protein